MCGVLAGIMFANLGMLLWPTVGILLVAVAASFIFGKRLSRIAAFCALAGGLSMFLNASKQLPPATFYQFRTYTAVVETVDRLANSQSLIVSIDDYRCRVSIMDLDPGMRPGDIIRFDAILEPVTEPLPHMEGLVRRDKASQISARISLTPDDVEILGHSKSIKYKPYEWAHGLRNAILDSQLNFESASLLATSLLGRPAGTPPAADAFRMAGVAHLLCISGFHVALIAGLLLLLLMPLRLWNRGLHYAQLISIPAVWAFVFATGAAPSAIRAAIMISIIFIAPIANRHVMSENSLAAALVIILLTDPYSFFSAGLWLSVCAVTGLLLLTKHINPFTPRHRILYTIFAAPATAFAAMLGTLPVIIFVFHSIPLVGIFANVLITPFFSLFVYLGLLVSGLNSLGFSVEPLAFICNAMMQWFNVVTDYVNSMPHGTLTGLYPSPIGLVFIGVVSLAIIYALRRPSIMSIGSAIIMVILVLFVPMNSPRREIIVNRHDIIENYGNHAHISLLRKSGRPDDEYNHYLAGCGVTDVTIGKQPQHPQFIVLDASSELPVSLQGYIVYLRRSYHCGADVLAPLHPQIILLDPNIPPDRRLALIRSLRERNIKVHDLAMGPWTYNMD